MFNIKINDNLKKNFNYKCLPFTGIVLSKGTKYAFNFVKDSVIIELKVEDKITNIENSKENTI